MRKIFQNFAFGLKKAVLVSLAASLTIVSANATPKEVFSDRYAAVVIDANSGKTLFDANANAKRYPASLTKMMTLYLLFEAMKTGRVTPNTPIPISAHAASRPPTKLGFKPGDTIPAEAAAKALITKSANDVAAAIGEYLGGTEENFSRIMTTKAHQLGMMNTNFANASGLPDVCNYSTARDMAALSLALRDNFPDKYKWFKITSFRFRGKEIRTHNHLVERMKGVDGIKTGYTQMSGANLASSMRLQGKNLVAVVMGGRSAKLRDTHMAELLRRYLPFATKKKSRSLILASANYGFKLNSAPPIPTPKDDISSILADTQFASNLYRTQAKDMDVPVPILKNEYMPRSPILTALTADENSENNNHSSANDAITSILVAQNNETPNNIEKMKQSNWTIQIGSVNSRKKAQELLMQAHKKSPHVFKKAAPYIANFQLGKKLFYRVRFNGFDTKETAQNACQAFKKGSIPCLVIKSS